MERYYIFFRCWEHFSPDSGFPFEKFDDEHDDKINDAVEAYAVNWRRENKSEFDRRVRETEKKLSAALRTRAKQRTSPPGADPAIGDELAEVIFDTSKPLEDVRAFRRALGLNPHAAENIQFEPGPTCSLGCRNAYRLGWISAPLQRFGGLSPSPRWFAASAGGEQCAKEAVDGLYKLLPSTDGWVDYGHLRICFGYLPANRFDTAKQLEIELGMEDLAIIKPSTFDECVQSQIAEVAARTAGWFSDFLKRKAEQSGTTAVVTPAAHLAGIPDTATPAAEDQQGSRDSTGEDGVTPKAGTGQGADVGLDGDHRKPWEPPEGFVRVSTIMCDERFQKQGKNPSRTTIQKWSNRDHPDVVHDPATNENCYRESWVLGCLKRWSPRNPREASIKR